MNDARIRPANALDLPAVLALLKAASLPEDIEPHIAHFLIAEVGEIPVGAIGAELYASEALLRSLVVAHDRRELGLGRALVREMIARLRSRGVERIFLLTTDAAAFFERFDFRRIERDAAPLAVQETREFRELCPSTAQVMRLDFRA